uniref:Uncharacterized protein n=1 Tax=Anguilla anguilla TaxID=7936 RepID=A0A0E9UUZ3_ANGAN
MNLYAEGAMSLIHSVCTFIYTIYIYVYVTFM